MIHVYYGDAPIVEPHLVNGKNGYVIRPNGGEDGEIFFENYTALWSWARKVSEQSLTFYPGGGETA